MSYHTEVIVDHVMCGLCKNFNIRRIVHTPYGEAEGKYISEACRDCGAFRVIRDDWANWRPVRKWSWEEAS